MKAPSGELIYSPARRRGIGTLTMFAGPSGSGKTKSALRYATGLASGGPIGVCDTEHGRALYYADDFDFQHLELQEPFSPGRFEQAAVVSQRNGHAVWICDSFSHEHVGPGGMLDMFEAELQRMAGNDYDKRERVKMAAWIKPKGEHKHLLQRLWQLNSCHIILCCHADKKVEVQKDPRTGKSKPVDIGYQPICSPDIPYAMTCSFLFDPRRPGVPIWIKHFDKVAHCFDTNAVIDEDTGRRMAAWARGDDMGGKAAGKERPVERQSATNSQRPPDEPPPPGDPPEGPPPGDPPEGPPPGDPPDEPAGDPPDEPAGSWREVSPDEVFEPGRDFRMNQATGQSEVYEPPVPGQAQGPEPPVDKAPGTSGPVDKAAEQQPGGDGGLFPGDLPLKPEPKQQRSKNEVVLTGLIDRFMAVKTRAEHFAIVDSKDDRDRIEWFKKNKPELHARLRAAMEDSWARTEPKKEVA